jgi:hypothetical protein
VVKRIRIANERLAMACMIAIGTISLAAFIYWLYSIIIYYT